ncbi:HAD family hydrolase [Spongiactinospora sp. TRM90649]|uniref:HAD family hydrolase n=1 Tax=Spongiactinospora sp. TRM90649 TaxID=3031114 RepID=UPI0023F8107A|nr:HAD family hydrolase [Spongiactinospora sp. TRM90649]MDF5757640.1 HAD family hydrolase [Spongiactinospora sp. TRM90649]
MQRLALFDLDDTLIDLRDAFRVWATEFAADHRLGDGAVDWLIALDGTGLAHRGEFFARVRERFALPPEVDELWAGYRRRMPHLVRCAPEVLASLARLRADGWRMGIVTNGTADNQAGKIEHSGLAEVVTGWACSGAEGVSKPDRRLFEIAAARCGASLADGGWMIGDSLVKDIGGGGAAGLRTVWVNAGGLAADRVQVDHVVGHVSEAVALLAGLR